MSNELNPLEWVQATFNNPLKKSQLLQQPEKLRSIINDVSARQWLFAQACQTDELNRASQAKDFIITMMKSSGLIWRGAGKISPDIYEEALSRAWEGFIKDLDQYNPEKANPVTWFNQKLRWRILDVIREIFAEEKRRLYVPPDEQAHELFYPPAPEPELWHETIQKWLELVHNHPHLLRNCRMQNHPDINCQFLLIQILQILRDSGEFSWNVLAQNYGVEASALRRFCKMRCFPIFQQLLSQ